MIFYIWVIALLGALALYFRQAYSKFRKYGVKHNRPIPLMGNTSAALFRITHFVDVIDNIYNGFPEERFVIWTAKFYYIIIVIISININVTIITVINNFLYKAPLPLPLGD